MRERLGQLRVVTDILRHLRLAVARGLQLRQHLEALLHPLVIHAILGARAC